MWDHDNTVSGQCYRHSTHVCVSCAQWCLWRNICVEILKNLNVGGCLITAVSPCFYFGHLGLGHFLK